MNALYLTAAEKALFLKLPAELREGWDIMDQAGDAFETDKQLLVRANMMELDTFPQLKALRDALRAGKKVDPASIKNIPEAALGEVLFALGARGISVLILHILGGATTDKNIESIAGFSYARRDILEVNAAVPA